MTRRKRTLFFGCCWYVCRVMFWFSQFNNRFLLGVQNHCAAYVIALLFGTNFHVRVVDLSAPSRFNLHALSNDQTRDYYRQSQVGRPNFFMPYFTIFIQHRRSRTKRLVTRSLMSIIRLSNWNGPVNLNREDIFTKPGLIGCLYIYF